MEYGINMVFDWFDNLCWYWQVQDCIELLLVCKFFVKYLVYFCWCVYMYLFVFCYNLIFQIVDMGDISYFNIQ